MACFYALMCRHALGIEAFWCTPHQIIYDGYPGPRSVVLISESGRTVDALAAFRACLRRPSSVPSIITADAKSDLAHLARGAGVEISLMPKGQRAPGFFPLTNTLLGCGTLVAATCDSKGVKGITEMFSSVYQDAMFVVNSVDSHVWSKKYFLVLHGPTGAPAAVDFRTRMFEAGIGAVYEEDIRNFCHGQYRWLARNIRDVAVVLFGSASDSRPYKHFLATLPDDVSIIDLRLESDDGTTALVQLASSMWMLSKVALSRHVSLDDPDVPAWGQELYRGGGAFLW